MGEKRRKKRRVNPLKVGITIGISAIIVVLAVLLLGKGKDIINKEAMYLASSDKVVKLYIQDDDGNLKEDKDLVRGTKVSSYKDTITKDNKSYTKIDYDKSIYYVDSGSLVKDAKSAVLEKVKYVRTSVTVYQNSEDSKIESFIKKGNKIDVTDYDKLLEDGSVNMYKIKNDNTEGWVYGKYLVNDEETANEVYNENSVYDTHKNRKYGLRELYGGKASTLDYYPYERVEFENNKLLKSAKAMYLNAGTIGSIDSYLKIAKENGVNAIVVDIKDGALAYSSEVAKEISPTAYKTAINDNSLYKAAIDKIKEASIYAIGRIVVFNDTHYAKDHPEDCINSTGWPSAYSRNVWYYNVELAKEAAREMGFNEIQFDYVRFPENAYNLSVAKADFKNKYDEEKAEAVQNFLFYATDQIHKEGIYLSVDVFGECSSEYVTAYGQYWPAISNIVDAISSMPYTDHFGRSVDTWTNAYQTVNNWAKGASARQKEIPTPAVARTWITAYDTPYWNPKVIYNASKIEDQVRALYDAGLDGGFITWNSASSLAKYEQIKSAFAKNYG
ncbi:MAG: putative glycoside hydrolase [Bacilli bacterium]|nr:putative glycoside hydrolase [Clostridium sp.]MDY2804253.1 putative glycoside hydrolase [Bacilli bacterium]